jgi:hypothetical protein
MVFQDADLRSDRLCVKRDVDDESSLDEHFEARVDAVDNAASIVDCDLFGAFRRNSALHTVETQKLAVLLVNDLEQGLVPADVLDLERF